MKNLQRKTIHSSPLLLEQVKVLAREGTFQFDRPFLRDVGNGFELHFNLRSGPAYLMAEKTRQVRVFARADTALRILWDLGVTSVLVENHRSKETSDESWNVGRT